MRKNIVFLCTIAHLFCWPILGQKHAETSLKIVRDKPNVYISYVRRGKQAPIFEGESENRIWLRIHNNTKLKIFFCEFPVTKEYGDVGIYYDVDRINPRENEPTEVPGGYGQSDACDLYTLPSGQTRLFSLPEAHLGENLAIRIRYYIGWTGNWIDDKDDGTFHFVKFGNDQTRR